MGILKCLDIEAPVDRNRVREKLFSEKAAGKSHLILMFVFLFIWSPIKTHLK